MSIKSEIEKSVRTRQRGMRVLKGDQFWRGLDLVNVLSAEGGLIVYELMSTGKAFRLPKKQFISVALQRVPSVRGFVGSQTDMAWMIASNKKLEASFRVRTLNQYLRSASDAELGERIKSWIFAIRAGKEPVK